MDLPPASPSAQNQTTFSSDVLAVSIRFQDFTAQNGFFNVLKENIFIVTLF